MGIPPTFFTLATVHNIALFVGILHALLEPVKMAGYNIPKGSLIIPSYQSFLHSAEHWKNPQKFDPQNFLDSDGKIAPSPVFMPFGGGENCLLLSICPYNLIWVFLLGPRMCLGINVAKQELFLFFVSMLQHFKLEPPPGILKLDEEYVPGLTVQPKQFQIVMKQRH